MKKSLRKAVIILCSVAVLSAGSLYSYAGSEKKQCTVTVRDNQTGKSYTVTFHGYTCSELIKKLMEN